jgi:autotransporter passenger strand-loop-strand repeat protein
MTITYVSSGAVSSGVVVTSGNELEVLFGGTIEATTVGSSGYEFVASGGVASGTIVSNGGEEFVVSGGVASGTIVSSGGLIELPLTSAYGPWSPVGANVIDGVTVQSGAAIDLDIYQGGSILGFVVGLLAVLLSGAAP